MPSNIASLSDADLLSVATQMNTALSANPAAYGLTPALITPLATGVSDFTTALGDHTTAQAAAKAKTIEKNDERTLLESAIRSLRDKATANNTGDSLMADLGLPSGGPEAPNATQ